ncbi:MAG: hypothetical protein J6Q05_03190, partial [Elusimicrobiaceae bacterium]|nr:hypothetical protein [Elusimicrobiaceae bacterium]
DKRHNINGLITRLCCAKCLSRKWQLRLLLCWGCLQAQFSGSRLSMFHNPGKLKTKKERKNLWNKKTNPISDPELDSGSSTLAVVVTKQHAWKIPNQVWNDVFI